ncbi:MAG: hypothetical protein KKE73_11555 [Proteobacteria bacterium]|nr:hypothetical protein [Pseudomonadota bacterium]
MHAEQLRNLKIANEVLGESGFILKQSSERYAEFCNESGCVVILEWSRMTPLACNIRIGKKEFASIGKQYYYLYAIQKALGALKISGIRAHMDFIVGNQDFLFNKEEEYIKKYNKELNSPLTNDEIDQIRKNPELERD